MMYFRFESLEEMISSPLLREIIGNWYVVACNHASLAVQSEATSSRETIITSGRLFQTQGFRTIDWPLPGPSEAFDVKQETTSNNVTTPVFSIEVLQGYHTPKSTVEILQNQTKPSLLAFSSKKSVPLLGGTSIVEAVMSKQTDRPRLPMIPTSYTDLYADLSGLLPDCEQTAFCLICGEVLNASGKGECTKHSYKCGAGTLCKIVIFGNDILRVFLSRFQLTQSPFDSSLALSLSLSLALLRCRDVFLITRM
jgi:hypothetical protein